MDDPDLSARKHLAGSDPAFPARREEAYARIVTALDEALGPLGYRLKGSTWSRSSERGKSAVHLQRSRYGWEAEILLRFVTPDGEPPEGWDGDAEVPLAEFGGSGGETGRLAFLDVLESPTLLSCTIEALVSEALPWLEKHHLPEG
jgi:hypothetical protein